MLDKDAMTKTEYKKWYRDCRTEARKIAQSYFESNPTIRSVFVPALLPIDTWPIERWGFLRKGNDYCPNNFEIIEVLYNEAREVIHIKESNLWRNFVIEVKRNDQRRNI